MDSKIIVITGGARGLGKAMADLFRSRGATVVTSDKNEDADVQVDVTKESEMISLVDQVVVKHGRIDVWINNAGVWAPPTSVEEINLEKAHVLFDVNFFGTLNGMRVAVTQMKKQKSGTIVNIISTTALDGMNGSSGSMYVASKYALRGLTNTVRGEIKEQNISVIGVYPGGMKTELFNEEKPANIGEFMSAESVAEKIVDNLASENPETELILKRNGQI